MGHVEAEQTLIIPAGQVELEGELIIPADALGLVLFAHGSGSSRRSPRNQSVAAALRERGLGTLLFDLLTPAEDEQDAHVRFDIPLLAKRLGEVTGWIQGRHAVLGLPLGYFGASTGAAAALIAASRLPRTIHAVVSRGGRPDLARDALERVQAPTLLIVGGDDPTVLELNEDALDRLPSVKKLVVIPGATHLFEEPGALDRVARLAGDWFLEQLAAPAQHRPAHRANPAAHPSS
jgi:putative phosphoribosyl transferase